MSFAKAFLHFYPRPPRGGRPKTTQGRGHRHKFLSTPSARRATINGQLLLLDLVISIHALREEGDFSSHMDANRALNFYPRPPRGGRRGRSSNAQCPSKISIHALREEGDTIQSVDKTSTQSFLSTPSARRATRYFSAATSSRHSFLSTPSARRATQFFDHRDFIQHDFYPRPPRGGRPQMSPACPSISYFYPRPPRGGRPATTSLTSTHKGISIHALREEGDAFQKLLLVFDCLFLSTPSARRATSSTKGSYTTPVTFLSTPSARRATSSTKGSYTTPVTFLSTPSARRATPTAARPIRHPPYFYPRPPRGGRPAAGLTITASTKISIHALREEGDGFWAAQRLSTTVFLSTPSARRATQVDVEILIFRGISIHALREEGDSYFLRSSSI